MPRAKEDQKLSQSRHGSRAAVAAGPARSMDTRNQTPVEKCKARQDAGGVESRHVAVEPSRCRSRPALSAQRPRRTSDRPPAQVARRPPSSPTTHALYRTILEPHALISVGIGPEADQKHARRAPKGRLPQACPAALPLRRAYYTQYLARPPSTLYRDE